MQLFFIWLSVFNLFAISLFWSLSSDLFSTEQAKRFYGPIAAGGSLGAIAGPIITTTIISKIGIQNLLLVSSAFLTMATWMVYKLISNYGKNKKIVRSWIGGRTLDGFISIWKSPLLKQIAIYLLLYTSVSTFLYFEQAHIISSTFDSGLDRTRYFATRDLLVNGITLLIQFLLLESIIKKWGIIFSLTLVPIFTMIGFILIGINQSYQVLLAVQVIYRSLNHSIQRPSREILFTPMSRLERYRSKNLIDTAIYRGGDALSGWFFSALTSLIGSMQLISLVVIPIALFWMISGQRAAGIFNLMTSKLHKDEKQIFAKRSA